jgi:hypothetical protein
MIDMVAVADAIWDLVDEGKFAEVAAALFHHHKKRLGFWVNLKAELLCSAKGSRDLLVIATLLDVSTKATLDESCHLVPGLNALIYRYNHDQ